MSDSADHPHTVRKVVLPSGKTIEVVYFDDQLVSGVPSAPVRDVEHEQLPDGELHRCGSCDSSLVYPLEWAEAGARHWEVTLRCPNCEWVGTGVFAGEAVERFDAELDRGTECLIADLRRLMQANMEEAVERFSAALNAGHILPIDF